MSVHLSHAQQAMVELFERHVQAEMAGNGGAGCDQ